MTDAVSQPRRRALIAAGALAAGLPAAARAQGLMPGVPLRILIPLPAGGVADSVVRVIADRLSTNLKQPVVVDNRPGGLFVIALQALAAAPADGHTLIHLNVGMCSVQAAMKRFDLLKAVDPVSESGYGPAVLFSSARAPFATLTELIAWGRANPGKLNYATLGPGSLEHLMAHEFFKSAGINAVGVPFKGGPDALTAMIQGEVQVAASIHQLAKQFAEKGALRIHGTFADSRMPAIPAVPTLKEQGLAVPALQYWGGFGAKAGTPQPLIDLLHRELNAATLAPEVQEKLAVGGNTPNVSPSPAAFRQKITADLAWMAEAVKSAGLNLS